MARDDSGLAHRFYWNDTLRSGCDAIDAEHRRIVDALNVILHKIHNRADRAELALLTADITHIAQTHFDHEEAMMASSGYLTLDEHRREHTALVSAFQRVREVLDQIAPEELSDIWILVGNIIVDDMMEEEKKLFCT